MEIIKERIIPGRLNCEAMPVISPQNPKIPAYSLYSKEYSENSIPSPTPQVTERAHFSVYAKIIINTPHITLAREILPICIPQKPPIDMVVIMHIVTISSEVVSSYSFLLHTIFHLF